MRVLGEGNTGMCRNWLQAVNTTHAAPLRKGLYRRSECSDQGRPWAGPRLPTLGGNPTTACRGLRAPEKPRCWGPAAAQAPATDSLHLVFALPGFRWGKADSCGAAAGCGATSRGNLPGSAVPGGRARVLRLAVGAISPNNAPKCLQKRLR